MITTLGKELLLHLLSGEDNDYVKIIAVGTGGTTAPTVDDTELVNETYRYNVAASLIGDVLTIRTYIPSHAPNQVISEAGLLTANGHLVVRDTFTPVTKSSNIPVLITWTITLSGV